jgi:radical SAM superfamily enzyme YgiQ (UPF0313 family)
MKVLLVNSPSADSPVVRDMAGGLGFDGGNAVVLPPLDLAYLAAGLLGKGHQAEIIDAGAAGLTRGAAHELIRARQADVVIATVSLPVLYSDCAFLKEMGAYFKGKIIAKTGIAYPPILQEILEKSSAGLCIYGECELEIDKVISGEEKRGTAYMEAGGFRMEANLLVEDLDALPLPARSLLDNGRYRYVLLGGNTTVMQTSRGCPFPCAYYCAYPLVQGRKWRYRSPGHVLREIEEIVNNHGIRSILFRDATFTMDKDRTHAICDLIIAGKFGIKWWCETRVDRLDEPLMRKMKAAGCAGINIGVESGDTEVMETQAKIGMTFDKLKAVRDAARTLGLRLHFLLMVGLPRESKKSIYETYKLMTALKPETIGVTILTPYPGTPFYHEAKSKGFIETENWSDFGGHRPVMHTPALSSEDLSYAQRTLNDIFYLRKAGLYGRLKAALLAGRLKKWAMKADGK